MNTFIKNTKSGQKVEVIGLFICLDGKKEADYLIPIANHPQQAAILKALKDATHIAGRIVFTASEAAVAQTALDAAEAAYEASPEGIEKALRSRREELALRIRRHMGDAEYYGNRAWESGQSTDGGFGIRAQHEAKANAVRAELATFDAEHPEIIAKIKSEKAAKDADMLDRHFWD